jgi:predicted Fe-S protein YdhL (DUF1289 family)
MSDAEPLSPCVSVCLLDEMNICVGCFRSADEITDWFMASAEQKREILRRTQQRREASTRVRLE